MPTAISLSTITSLEIGSSTNTMAGGLDGFRMYDSILTPTQITALYNDTCDFNPSQITSSLWLDAQDQTTITESAGAVSQWDDKSGNANHVSQGVGALQPTISGSEISAVNGQFLSKSSGTNLLDANGKCTLFFMHTSIDMATSEASFLDIFLNLSTEAGSTNRRPSVIYSKGTNGLRFNNSSTNSGFDYITNDYSNKMFCYDVILANDQRVYVDGMLKKTINNQALDFSTTHDKTTIGTTNAQSSPIIFSEIVLVTGGISESDRQKIEGYLAWKWGNVINLPSTHPYKNSPPRV